MSEESGKKSVQNDLDNFDTEINYDVICYTAWIEVIGDVTCSKCANESCVFSFTLEDENIVSVIPGTEQLPNSNPDLQGPSNIPCGCCPQDLICPNYGCDQTHQTDTIN